VSSVHGYQAKVCTMTVLYNMSMVQQTAWNWTITPHMCFDPQGPVEKWQIVQRHAHYLPISRCSFSTFFTSLFTQPLLDRSSLAACGRAC